MKKHETMMKKHDKMKNACQFFGCPLEAKTLILLMKFHYDLAPGIENDTKKHSKKHQQT